jgi:hypothetical protein
MPTTPQTAASATSSSVLSPRPSRVSFGLLVGLLLLPGCGLPVWGSGVPAQRLLEVGRFTALHLPDVVSVRVTNGDPGEASLRCDDNLIDQIHLDLDDEGELEVGFNPGISAMPRVACELTIHRQDLREIDISGAASFRSAAPLPRLRSVEVSGAGEVDIGAGGADAGAPDEGGDLVETGEGSDLLAGEETGSLLEDDSGGLVEGEEPTESGEETGEEGTDDLRDADHLSVDISGSGSVWIAHLDRQTVDLDISGSGDLSVRNLSAHRITADISGSGSVTLRGTTDRLNAEVSGAGDISARHCQGHHLDANVSGSGNIEAWADRSADVHISGAGAVTVWGDPEQRSKHISGAGSVRFP